MDEHVPVVQDQAAAESRRRGTLVLRTLPLLALPIVAILLTVVLFRLTTGGLFELDRPPAPRGSVGRLFTPLTVAVIFCSALIILVRLGRPNISALALIGTWTLLTTIGTLRTGVTSYAPALLILPICAAGLLIDRVASISLAGLATLFVVGLAWLEQYGDYVPMPMPLIVVANFPVVSAGFWIGVFWSVAILTALLAGGLQHALKQSYAHAEELQRLSDQLEARVAEQTALLVAQEREAATLEERARLAREIHDTLAQGLAGTTVQISAAQRALTVAPDEVGNHLELAGRMAREALAEARRSVWNLRAAALGRGDLSDALRGLAERQTRPDLAIHFERQGEPGPLPPNIESALLRVAQESLANAAKHAGANQITMRLEYMPDMVRLVVQDDGVGFDEASLIGLEVSGPWGGFGLAGMRERLIDLGGTLELQNEVGAVVIATAPRSTKVQGSGP